MSADAAHTETTPLQTEAAHTHAAHTEAKHTLQAHSRNAPITRNHLCRHSDPTSTITDEVHGEAVHSDCSLSICAA